MNEKKIKVKNQKVPRHKEKYAALNFKRQVKLRLDALDGIEEYVDKLTDKQKDWLNRFLEETIITNFQHKGALIYKSKKKRREFYRNNNERNRCMLNKAKHMGALLSISDANALASLIDGQNLNEGVNSEEDAMLTMIAAKRSGAFDKLDD